MSVLRRAILPHRWGKSGVLYGLGGLHEREEAQNIAPGRANPGTSPYTCDMIQVPMSDAQFATATTRLRNNGIELTGPSGTLTKDGITAKYQHADGKLSVEIVDRPSLLPLSLIEGRLQAYLEQSIAAGEGRSA